MCRRSCILLRWITLFRGIRAFCLRPSRRKTTWGICHFDNVFGSNNPRIVMQQLLPIAIRLRKLIKLALRFTSASLHPTNTKYPTTPQSRTVAIGCYASRLLLFSLSYRSTLVTVHIQRHEVIRIAVRLFARIRRFDVALPLHASSWTQTILIHRFLISISISSPTWSYTRENPTRPEELLNAT